MSAYSIKLEGNNILRIKFGDQPAGNDQIVKDANSQIETFIQDGKLAGGKLLKINGPASLPVAMLLGHKLAHLYETVACFDPKLEGYVVVSVHGGKYALGDVLS